MYNNARVEIEVVSLMDKQTNQLECYSSTCSSRSLLVRKYVYSCSLETFQGKFQNVAVL